MCGIAGIIGPNPSEAELQKMLQAQHHRGPDHTGTYFDPGFAAIGHNRLSIIDLSPDANEPFIDNSGRYYLSFNGEIYNYKELKEELKPHYNFKTSSDTEVLLAAFIYWGKECLNRFNGMFSFAIWDCREKKLFAARDRFGVKPFYYSEADKNLYFSSEIKTLKNVIFDTPPNLKVWANYFSYGSYGMPEEAFYSNIKQLPGGYLLEYSEGRLKLEKWYNFVSRVQNIRSESSIEQAKAEYLELLKDSIKLRFRADVPVAFNISGGVDSSLLLALVNMFEDKQQVNAYSFYTGDERYDELPWVEQMISTTQNPLHKVLFSASEVQTNAIKMSRQQDEPFGGIPTMAYSKIFEQAHANGVKVLLDGQGMDEQWAGYDYYQTSGSIIQGTGQNSPFRTHVLNPEFAALAQKTEYPEPFDNRLQNLQFRDLFYTKLPRALRFNDRVSMTYSTELREPFLDYRLVELAFAQPEGYKIKNGVGKYMLREILKPLVPSTISYAPKRPLQTPQREWLSQELKAFVEEKLLHLKNTSATDWFDHEKIQKEWKKYLAGDNTSSFHVWQWVNTALLL
ncbi:asparagine synthase (glutamine-hydrolyzing) [Salinimicrobium sp. MT39]|uniref:asparagine synthase (glutamine-hydrolyzing) n=1 Tax=Salinimicrobium profundisediminis TaxID=2994553 RepID=A0A9X3I0I0_9FLAO|nr:asparagine synthase (glutamine-hydrolyzing) [Salinimicrobium profundisediminis]MCX2837458.1 asparagine synthase (glutamine-hydrolyzing) [Salinimicrobium profundisediminis]